MSARKKPFELVMTWNEVEKLRTDMVERGSALATLILQPSEKPSNQVYWILTQFPQNKEDN